MAIRSAKKKWRLPNSITALNPEDLSVIHMKVMLDFMGTAVSNQPVGKPAKIELLNTRIAENPAKAQAGYDVIVLNKLPEANENAVKETEALRAHMTSVLNGLIENEQLDHLKVRIEKATAELTSRVEKHGLKAMAEAAKAYRPVVITQGKKKKVVKGILPDEFERIVQLGSQRIPIMLVGPAGCGKTFIAEKLAESLDLPFYDQSCSEGVSESTFTGWLLPVDGKGSFTYVPAPFITCYENGGVFLLDEVDASDANLMTFLNKAIANSSFMLPQRYKKPLVKKHKDFVVIAAANTFGHGADAQYVGRNALDAATLDRYRVGMVNMDYSDAVESALIDSDVLAWGRKVRGCIKVNRLRRIMSTRVMLDLTKMTENCSWTKKEWEESYFADWTSEEKSMWGRIENVAN